MLELRRRCGASRNRETLRCAAKREASNRRDETRRGVGAQNWENTTTRGATRLVLREEKDAEKAVRVREPRVDAASMARRR